MDRSSIELMQEAGTSQPNNESESEEKIAELARVNTILKANISTLFRTAKAEIARKNKMISELQSELDNLIFKRMDRRIDQGIKNSSNLTTTTTSTTSSNKTSA